MREPMEARVRCWVPWSLGYRSVLRSTASLAGAPSALSAELLAGPAIQEPPDALADRPIAQALPMLPAECGDIHPACRAVTVHWGGRLGVSEPSLVQSEGQASQSRASLSLGGLALSKDLKGQR